MIATATKQENPMRISAVETVVEDEPRNHGPWWRLRARVEAIRWLTIEIDRIEVSLQRGLNRPHFFGANRC
jgi:hypothetical protein